jgi:hypothetical protein
MPSNKKTLRTCPNGHPYYKSSDCPVCPICEKERAPESGFLSKVSAPARRALEREGITTLKKLAAKTQAELMTLHGMGPKAMLQLHVVLEENGLSFKKK